MTSSLENKIKYLDEQYRSGNALVSDAQFDQLEANLQRIDPKADYFISKNNLALPSLPKDNIEEFIDGLLPRTRLIIEPKIDGCAIAIKYIDGKFDSTLSRKGKDVSRQIQAVKNIPKEINIGSHLVVRG